MNQSRRKLQFDLIYKELKELKFRFFFDFLNQTPNKSKKFVPKKLFYPNDNFIIIVYIIIISLSYHCHIIIIFLSYPYHVLFLILKKSVHSRETLIYFLGHSSVRPVLLFFLLFILNGNGDRHRNFQKSLWRFIQYLEESIRTQFFENYAKYYIIKK